MTTGGTARGVARKIVNRVRRSAGFGRWLITDFARDPGLELYAARQGRKTARFVAESRAGGTAAQLAPFSTGGIPRTLWMYWAQGEVAAPPIVRRCMESWREGNPGWDIRVLDDAAAAAVVELSDVPAAVPVHTRADVLRLRLLRAHGGVWADATCWCHRPLDEWLPLQAISGFFVFDRPGPDRLVANWFIASRPDHPLVAAWDDALSAYLRRRQKRATQYFMTHYTLQWRLQRDPDLRAVWERTAHLPAQPAFALMAALTGDALPGIAREMIRTGFPVSKLSHKVGISDEVLDAVLK